jgi:hypothetical protein
MASGPSGAASAAAVETIFVPVCYGSGLAPATSCVRGGASAGLQTVSSVPFRDVDRQAAADLDHRGRNLGVDRLVG